MYSSGTTPVNLATPIYSEPRNAHIQRNVCVPPFQLATPPGVQVNRMPKGSLVIRTDVHTTLLQLWRYDGSRQLRPVTNDRLDEHTYWCILQPAPGRETLHTPHLSTPPARRAGRRGPFSRRYDVVPPCGAGVARTRSRGRSGGARESHSITWHSETAITVKIQTERRRRRLP